MSRRSRAVWWIAIAVAGATLLTAGAVGFVLADLVPFRISRFWPIDLVEPGRFLIDRRIRELRDDPGLCESVLKAPAIKAHSIADQEPRDGCGWRNSYRITSVGGARLSVDKMTCELAAAVALWSRHVVEPEAQRLLGSSVTGVEHLGTYACRNIRGNQLYARFRSAHATANALDLAAFRLADGRRISVKQDWTKEGPEGQFLKAVHRGSCRYFRVAIGPDYNAAHRDHLHLDRSPYRACK